MKEKALKPFLKWAGGKRQLLPEIRKHLPPDFEKRVYYEPFAGAGAVLFDLQPEKAVIADINKELITAYSVVRDDPDGLIELLVLHGEKNCQEYYYKIRELDRDAAKYAGLSDTEKAARTIYLNKTGYNGLYRVNSGGYFNVPWGRYKNPSLFDEASLRAIHEYLTIKNIELRCCDFENAVKDLGEDAFVYFDPPYHQSSKTGFISYQAGGFGEADQVRLRDLYVCLTKKNIPCLLSNADTPFIREIYQNKAFDVIPVKARRAINSDRSGRGRVNEVLIKNWSNT
ncbi:site-specific DNA-methyltransferase (adenine-specific) [Spirochaetia bacterium]|nr:site-specific DNA-methyltransferase (adenine-specific) [Spirochaetia bacterium]